jgi:hypothetical protein
MQKAYSVLPKVLFASVLILLASSLIRLVNADASTAPEMTEFWQILVYGSGSWLYLILFLGIGFLISWRVWPFSLVMMVACVYVGYDYAYNTPDNSIYAWRIVLLFVSCIFFIIHLAYNAKKEM